MSTRYHFNRPVGGAVTLPQKYTKNREEDLTIIRPQKIKQTNTKRRKKKKKIMVNRDVSMNRRQWQWTSNKCNIFCFCWSEKMCGDCNHGKAGVVLREVTIHGAAFINERLQTLHGWNIHTMKNFCRYSCTHLRVDSLQLCSSQSALKSLSDLLSQFDFSALSDLHRGRVLFLLPRLH